MRSSLFILGIFTATLCVAQPAAAQNYPWCVYENFAGGATNCGFSTFQQCWAARTGNSDSCGANPQYQGVSGPAPSSRRARGHSY
jgi:hypothetical protein